MPQLIRWLPETFDAAALDGVPDGVLVDTPLPDDETEALGAFRDAMAVAVANGDDEGVAALNRLWEDVRERPDDEDGVTYPDYLEWLDDPTEPDSGDWIDADADGDPLWPDDDEDDGPTVTESRRKGPKINGERRDSLGRRRCYVEGKLVKCPAKPDDPNPPAPPNPATPWDRPDWERSLSKAGKTKWVRFDGTVKYGPTPGLERPPEQKKREWEERAKRLAEPARGVFSNDPAAASVARRETERLMGTDDPTAWARLLGVPSGTVVSASAAQYSGQTQVGLSLTHPDVSSWSRSVTPNADGTLRVSNNCFFVKFRERGTGLGAKAFSEQVRQCFAEGVSEITTTAGKGGAGGDKMNGYYTWAKFGYDADLEPQYRYRLPAEFKGARTVQDLMAMPGGSDHWKATGYMTGMRFDLTPGSRSLRVLNEYLALKGKGAPPIPDTDPAAIAARAAVIARRQARMGKPPESFIDSQIAGAEYAVEEHWRTRIYDPASHREVARRVAADPDASADRMRPPDRTPEERFDALWLRHSRGLAGDRFDSVAGLGVVGPARLASDEAAAEFARSGALAHLPDSDPRTHFREAARRHMPVWSGNPEDAAVAAMQSAWRALGSISNPQPFPPAIAYGWRQRAEATLVARRAATPGPALPSSTTTESLADPYPMPELLAAMVAALLGDDPETADAMADIADDPEATAEFLADLWDAEAWQAAKTRGKSGAKAVWSGDGKRKPLYGERARRALAQQSARDRGETLPETPREMLTRQKREAEPLREEARAAWTAAVGNPEGVTPEQVQGLRAHLNALTRDELRDTLRELGSVGRGFKADVVARMLAKLKAKPEAVAVAEENVPPAPEPESPAATEATARVRLMDAIAGNPRLSDGQKAAYAKTVGTVLANMPPAAVAHVDAALKTAAFYPDKKTLTAEMFARVAETPGLTDAERASVWAQAKRVEEAGAHAAGGFIARSGAVHLDGAGGTHRGLYGGAEGHRDVYAHELSHAIDYQAGEGGRPLSASAAWAEVFRDEIVKPPAEGSFRLTDYATTKASEGFAEFGRLLYGGRYDLAQVERDFPKASALFKAKGLWPGKGGAERPAAIPEVFDRDNRIDLGGDSHGDVPLPAAALKPRR